MCFAFVDFDLYRPILDALEFVGPPLTQNLTAVATAPGLLSALQWISCNISQSCTRILLSAQNRGMTEDAGSLKRLLSLSAAEGTHAARRQASSGAPTGTSRRRSARWIRD